MPRQDELMRFGPISGDDIAAFNRSRGVRNTHCERCGEFNWAVHNSDADATVAALPTAKDNVRADVDLFIALILMSCINCGNVWIIDRALFENWRNGTIHPPAIPQGAPDGNSV